MTTISDKDRAEAQAISTDPTDPTEGENHE